MFDGLRRRNIAHALVESDARALFERFGEDACWEARLRHNEAADMIECNLPRGRWERVKDAIGKRQVQRRATARPSPMQGFLNKSSLSL